MIDFSYIKSMLSLTNTKYNSSSFRASKRRNNVATGVVSQKQSTLLRFVLNIPYIFGRLFGRLFKSLRSFFGVFSFGKKQTTTVSSNQSYQTPTHSPVSSPTSKSSTYSDNKSLDETLSFRELELEYKHLKLQYDDNINELKTLSASLRNANVELDGLRVEYNKLLASRDFDVVSYLRDLMSEEDIHNNEVVDDDAKPLNIETLQLWKLLREALKPRKDLDGNVSSPDDIDEAFSSDQGNWREIETDKKSKKQKQLDHTDEYVKRLSTTNNSEGTPTKAGAIEDELEYDNEGYSLVRGTSFIVSGADNKTAGEQSGDELGGYEVLEGKSSIVADQGDEPSNEREATTLVTSNGSFNPYNSTKSGSTSGGAMESYTGKENSTNSELPTTPEGDVDRRNTIEHLSEFYANLNKHTM